MNLKYIEHIIDRVADRYPYMTKHQIVVIITTMFQFICEGLKNGDTISMNNFLPNMMIKRFARMSNNKQTTIYKAIISTPAKMKNPK